MYPFARELAIESWILYAVANITARVSSDPIVHEEQPTPHAEALMVWGNKAIFMLEQFALVTIWLVKGCLLIIYNRLTYANVRSFCALEG
ncbi:hypothetical protein APSETT444_007119 [Aspergillus pseudonomiae]